MRKMRPINSLLLAVAAFMAVASCSTTKVVPEGSYRLVDNAVTITRSVGEYPKNLPSDISNYIKQKPNSYFIGHWNPFIFVYNWTNGKGKGWDKFVKKLGFCDISNCKTRFYDKKLSCL